MTARTFIAGVAAASVAGVGLSMAAALPASAATGDRSLATVLTSDGNKFDSNSKDFDVLTEAVLAVLKAKPNSPVKVLTKGKTKLTTFAPTDKAFASLVHSLTGKTPSSEAKTFAAVAGLGIDTVETVLLYHVVPGATITAKQALKADGAKLKTATGQTVGVDVHGKTITLIDKDTNSRNPKVIATDINAGNAQIAHAIDRVLRPMNLRG